MIGALVHGYPPCHLAGAETMLHSTLKGLAGKHLVRVVVERDASGRAVFPYMLDGVQVTDNRAALGDCDVLLTHLDRTKEAESYAKAEGVPLVHFVHNHLQLDFHEVTKADLIVYNTQWLADAVGRPGIVVPPPIWRDDYATKPGECITLVNLNAEKGVHQFWALAERMPDCRFLGVLGSYGVQVRHKAPNVEIVGPFADMREVYGRTKVLLMPSNYESYGRCAVEAACSGIPCVANPTDGLIESLGSAGIFPPDLDDLDAWEAAIRDVLANWSRYSRKAKALAAKLDPAGDIALLERAMLAL